MSIINTPQLYALWNAAQNGPECNTIRLLCYVYQRIFNGENWAIFPEQPPTDDLSDLRRIDLTPNNWHHKLWTRVIFTEVKSSSASPADLEIAEYQAFTACCAYLHYFRKDRAWAVTGFAGKFRIWIYQRGHDYLTPFIPKGDSLATKEEYIDMNSSDGHLLERGLRHIKDHITPSIEACQGLSSPRPKNIRLPDGWNDFEVPWVSETEETSLTTTAGPSTYLYHYPEPRSVLGNTAKYSIGEQSTHVGSKSEDPDPVEEHYPLVPDDAVEVVVKVEHNDSGDLYHFHHETQHYIRENAEWETRTVVKEGNHYECFLSTGKTTGKHFYTYDLQNLELYEPKRGKGKEKKKGRGATW